MNIAALFTLSPSHRPWRDNRSVPEFPLICIEYFHVKTVLLKYFARQFRNLWKQTFSWQALNCTEHGKTRPDYSITHHTKIHVQFS